MVDFTLKRVYTNLVKYCFNEFQNVSHTVIKC
jgi:hypothetical protein